MSITKTTLWIVHFRYPGTEWRKLDYHAKSEVGPGVMAEGFTTKEIQPFMDALLGQDQNNLELARTRVDYTVEVFDGSEEAGQDMEGDGRARSQ